jgi:hypothetical protein
MQNIKFMLGAAALTLVACGGAAPPAAFKADFKTSSTFFTNMAKPVDNSGMDAAVFVHKLQQTWYSSNAKSQLGGKVDVGTVSVKETYSADGTASGSLYVMIKTGEDKWNYSVVDATGAAKAGAPSGENVAMCHGCHTKFKDKDYLGATAQK